MINLPTPLRHSPSFQQSFGQTWLTKVPQWWCHKRGSVPVRPSFTPVDSPSQTKLIYQRFRLPAVLCIQNAPSDTIKSGQANRGNLAGSGPVQSPNSTPLTSVWLKGHCVWENSCRIQSFIKGHYFSTALNLCNLHLELRLEREKKNGGLHRIVYCACKIYVLWSPAISLLQY